MGDSATTPPTSKITTSRRREKRVGRNTRDATSYRVCELENGRRNSEFSQLEHGGSFHSYGTVQQLWLWKLDWWLITDHLLVGEEKWWRKIKYSGHGQSLIVHTKMVIFCCLWLFSFYSKKLKDFPLFIQLVGAQGIADDSSKTCPMARITRGNLRTWTKTRMHRMPPRSSASSTRTTNTKHNDNNNDNHDKDKDTNKWLAGGIPTPLKNDGVRQIGSSSQLLQGLIKFMSQTTNQLLYQL